MGNNKTVFVVGAGASYEFGLPVGSQLKSEISTLLKIQHDSNGRMIESGSPEIADAFAKQATDAFERDSAQHRYVESASKISRAMRLAPSIDNFMDVHNNDEHIQLCGKLAIVLTILEAERKSALYIDNGAYQQTELNNSKIADSWITSFFQMLVENCRLEDLEARFSAVALIVFNYDRCIEHFLLNALTTYYNVDEKQAASLLGKLVIHHPYGTVGDLPWRGGEKKQMPFGGKVYSDGLLKLASGIRTFTEGTDSESSDITEIRRHYKQAQRVVFLGFAYHKLNLELLFERSASVGKTRTTRQNERRYFGSALGISPSDCEIIRKELSSAGLSVADNILLRNDLTCAQLMKEYWKSLSW